jgi:hypothetical protein
MSPRNVGVVFCVFATCEVSSLLVDCCCHCPFFSLCFLILSRWISFCQLHVLLRVLCVVVLFMVGFVNDCALKYVVN